MKVTRWYPGVVEEMVEEFDGDAEATTKRTAKLAVAETILKEASKALDKDMERQTTITKERPIEEIIQEAVPLASNNLGTTGNVADLESGGLVGTTPKRRPRRVKTRSTPVVGGDMFASPQTESVEAPVAVIGRDQSATLTVDGKVYKIRVDRAALERLRGVESVGDMSTHATPGVGKGPTSLDTFRLGAGEIRTPRRQRQVSYDHMLQGHVRKQPNDFFAPIPE